MCPAEPGLMRLALPLDATEAPAMDEETFRAFYDRTARPVWAYLRRLTGDPSGADDLLQETYFRFLRASPSFESDAHQLHYLFRVAASVASDCYRRRRPEFEAFADSADAAADP